MSKIMNAGRYRRQLLATVSSMALLGSVHGAMAGSDADRPPVWIEFNWQYDRLSGMGDPYLPPFTDKILAAGFKSPAFAEKAIPFAYGGGGSLSFQPEGSDWIFSASMRYGRSHGRKGTHEQTPGGPRHVEIITPSAVHTGYLTPVPVRFAETKTSNGETHAILDFQAGKEVGLGMFGGESILKFGLRYAQLNSRRSAGIHADPDFYFPSKILKYDQFHHTYTVTSHIDRSFRGLGPSISWNASAPLAGNLDAGEIALDWGVNAAALFGRQRTRGHHQTTGIYYKTNILQKYHLRAPIARSGNPDRSRSVVAPNVGGFAGLSLRYSNAKISLGYRGDFFFGALDGGIDTRKSTTLGFNGPFASISVGLGD
jgi:iron complex outermembrane recepter protein